MENTFMSDDLKSSAEWYEEIPKAYGFKILDPDGWDRKRYDFSFNEEQITKSHFLMRVMYSTCKCSIQTILSESEWAKL
jgi:hypothetical protein